MKKLILVLALLVLTAAPLSAQTFLTNTTLSSPVTSTTQNQWVVASATNIEVGGQLYVDQEVVTVTAVSGTTITVFRSQRPMLHSASAVVFVATKAQSRTNFVTHDAARRSGVCSTSTSSANATALAGMILPVVDTDTGDMYGCRRNGAGGSWVWNITNVVGLNGAGSLPTAQ